MVNGGKLAPNLLKHIKIHKNIKIKEIYGIN